MPLRAVFFDIDGTLVDSNEQHVNAWALSFCSEGHPQELDAIRAQIGKGGDLLVPALLPDADGAMRTRLSEGHGERFKDMYLDDVRPFEGAAALVRRTHDCGYKVLLASSAKRDELDHYVELLDIASLIDATTSIDDVETSKPAPDIFSVALEKAGVAPAEAIVIGDTPYDVEAARRSGIAAIGLTSGPFDEATLREAGATAVYRDVSALLAEFDRSPLSCSQRVTEDAMDISKTNEAALRANECDWPVDETEAGQEARVKATDLSEIDEAPAEGGPELREIEVDGRIDRPDGRR